jgi:hypothetical protein
MRTCRPRSVERWAGLFWRSVKESRHESIQIGMETLTQITRAKGIFGSLVAALALGCSGRVEIADSSASGGVGAHTFTAGAGSVSVGGRSSVGSGGSTWADGSGGIIGEGGEGGEGGSTSSLPSGGDGGYTTVATPLGGTGAMTTATTHLGGTTVTKASGGVGGTSVTKASGGVGGTSVTKASGGVGGTSVTKASGGVGGSSVTMASGGVGGSSVTMASGGVGGTSVTIVSGGTGGSVVTTSAGGTSEPSTCANVVCPALPDLCTQIVQSPNACCPVCLASSCPACAESLVCPTGTHVETLAGACCPECVNDPPDACTTGQASYVSLRESLTKKYSTLTCSNSSDCGIVPEKNLCAETCGIPVPITMASSVVNTLESTAKSCKTCPPPVTPPCLPSVPACVNQKCVAVSPG